MNQNPFEDSAKLLTTLGEKTIAISNILQPYFVFFGKHFLAIQESMASFAQAMSQYTSALQEPLLRIMVSEEKKQRTVKAFQECDLWLAPSMLKLSDKITQLYYEGKKQVIPSVISRYYRNNNWSILRNTVHYWGLNSYFAPRMNIIYDALGAHVNGKYTLSIPTLLPHIEGIASDIVKKHKIPKLKEPVIYTKAEYGMDGAVTQPSRVFSGVAINAFSYEEWTAIEGLLYYLEGILYFSPPGSRKGINNQKNQPQLKRHLILHGIQKKYATSMNSLRCFLALDVLSLINENKDKSTK